MADFQKKRVGLDFLVYESVFTTVVVDQVTALKLVLLITGCHGYRTISLLLNMWKLL